jgi:hypothetical protein
MPENLMNHNIDLMTLEDPLALSMIATRDPEAPMALAAAARLSPLGEKSKLLKGVFQVVGETTKHPLIAKCISLITDSAFDPEAIVMVRKHACQFIINTRQEYTLALRRNMQALLDGTIAPRYFVSEFFELTEAGNMHCDIRKKLVLSLLVSENIRPSIKFLFLENFDRLPTPVQKAILSEVLKAEPSHHMEIIKEELRWMASKKKQAVNNLKPVPLAPLASPTEKKVVMQSKPIPKPRKIRAWRPGESLTQSGSMEILWN